MRIMETATGRLATVDSGTGIPVLFVHGFPLSHAMWRPQVEDLRAHCRVIAPDLRGFGQSEVTAGTVTMEQYADDLNALLDALEIAEPVVFCGLSMGGYIAWQFLRKYRPRLRGLILCDTRAVADTPEAAQGRNQMAERVLIEGASVAAEAMLPKLFAKSTAVTQPGLVESVKQTMLATDPKGIAAALRGMAVRNSAVDWLPTLVVPAMVVVGIDDVISTAAEMRSIAAAIPGAEFLEVPDAGHMSTLENPAVVNTAIKKFISRL